MNNSENILNVHLEQMADFIENAVYLMSDELETTIQGYSCSGGSCSGGGGGSCYSSKNNLPDSED